MILENVAFLSREKIFMPVFGGEELRTANNLTVSFSSVKYSVLLIYGGANESCYLTDFIVHSSGL